MGYVEDTLGTGESIIYVVSFHWLWTFLACFYLLIGVGSGVSLITLFPAEIHGHMPTIVLLYLASFFCFFLGFTSFFFMMIKKWTTERVLTDSRFVKKTGWIIRNTEDIRIDRMEEINFNQTILGRIFDYGNITISGMGSGSIRLNMIDGPIDFQRNLNDLKFQYSQKNIGR